jgi:hypothetical protein
MLDAGMVEKKSAGAALWMREAVEAIDKQFGDGYAREPLSWWRASCSHQSLIWRVEQRLAVQLMVAAKLEGLQIFSGNITHINLCSEVICGRQTSQLH